MVRREDDTGVLAGQLIGQPRERGVDVYEGGAGLVGLGAVLVGVVVEGGCVPVGEGGAARVADACGVLYFTFFERAPGDRAQNPEGPSDSHRNWKYSFTEIADIAGAAGWSAEYVGDWGHERGQMMVKARLSR